MQNLKKLQELYILKSLGVKYVDNEIVEDNDIDINHLPNNLASLSQVISNCNLCSLHKSRKNIVFGVGNENADLMFIGEAPGMYEDQEGLPFVGRSGELLNKMISNVLFIKREDVYIANILKCRPPNNRAPLDDEVDFCKGYLLKQISIIKPKIIVALGSVSFKYLLHDNTSISKARGHVFNFNGIKLIPTFHPSFLLRNPSAKKDAFEDLKIIKQLLDDL
jgi:DNA polymerase